ncbi:MAG: DUF2889 domain-containing protein [Candidatus Accumulibacter sp.]|nr:DUF2889 domain-containing protein [Accumulibacter sp.]
MPLPQPTAQRTRLHVRSVQIDGYKRADGRWDIEARLIDSKDHDYPLSSGLRKPGEAVHDMWVRVTIDAETNILEAAVCTDASPYTGYCERITPAYAQLVGLNLMRGFRTAVKSIFPGTLGCSHLSELAMILPTAALQTFASEWLDDDHAEDKPYQLDRCHALDSHSETVKRYYPRWYRSSEPG